MRHQSKRTTTTRTAIAGALAVGVVAIGAGTASATPQHRPATAPAGAPSSGQSVGTQATHGGRAWSHRVTTDRSRPTPPDAGERASRWRGTDARGEAPRTRSLRGPAASGSVGAGAGRTASASTGTTSGTTSSSTTGTTSGTTSGTTTASSGLSGLSSKAQGIRSLVLQRWPSLTSFSGYRAGAGDHGTGHAIDVMIPAWSSASGRALGQEVADYVQAHASELGVTYVIWRQHIWSVARADEGWRLMEDRGSATQNHDDHVHVSVS